MIARLNNPGPASTTTWIRLKQAQIRNWEPSNILVDPLPKDFNVKGNLSAMILKLANSLDITIRSTQWSEKFKWKEEIISIKTILDDTIEYKKAIPSLRKKKILYLDQILNTEHGSILSWNCIQLLNKAGRGPKPTWYKKIVEKITRNNTSNLLKDHWTNLYWKTQNKTFLFKKQKTDNKRIN